METEKLFPIFGQLHQDDAPALVIPCEKPARKVFENIAKLYVMPVSGKQSEPSGDEDEEGNERFKLTGDTQQDAETDLRALAFLIDFLEVTGTGELRRVAGVIGEFRGELR